MMTNYLNRAGHICLRSARFFLRTFTLALALAPTPATADFPIQKIKLPPGFSINLFASVPGARSMVVVEKLGTIFVGTRDDGVYGVSISNGSVSKVLSGLHVPNGITYNNGYLYIAEQNQIVRYRAGGLSDLKNQKPEILFTGLPDKSWHGWRYAAFGPDNGLYVSVGAPCNICMVSGLEGTILRLDEASGWQPQVYARGVRNSVGMAFHPTSGVLYFTDNGADNMGDDSPPDELNTAPKAGIHFGYPYFGGGKDKTSIFGNATPPAKVTFPAVSFQAHVAALGLHFYQGNMFPKQMRGQVFVAQHGSWNRSEPVGYRVMRIKFDKTGNAVSSQPFAWGWLNKDGSKWGRPVDVKELPDGALLISDDEAGAIWKISFAK